MSTATVNIGFDDPWVDPADAAFEIDETRPSLINRLSHSVMRFLQLEEAA